MPTAIFFRDETEIASFDIPRGTSLMTAAVAKGVPGIIADCGGQMSCATCHVVVDPAFAGRLPPASEAEEQMLDFTAMPREPHSRLSCQIVMDDRLEGIRVRIADPQ